MMNTSSCLNKKKILYLIILSIFLITTQASGIPDYVIDNYVISSGGNVSSNGDYSVQGSIGQPVTATSSSANYKMQSGFWHEIPELVEEIFKDSFE